MLVEELPQHHRGDLRLGARRTLEIPVNDTRTLELGIAHLPLLAAENWSLAWVRLLAARAA